MTVLVTGKDYRFSEWGARGALIALSLFVVAGVLSVLARASRMYAVASRATLAAMIDERWTDDEVDARNVTAALQVDSTRTLRSGNNKKADQLLYAHGFQLAAILVLIGTLAYELRDRL